MDIDSYKIEGSKSAAKKLMYFFVCCTVWYIGQFTLYRSITGCYTDIQLCSSEQVNLTLWLSSFRDLPLLIFSIYIIFYSVKVVVEKKLPPEGYGFPFSIDKVIKRDHYTFGITGIIFGVSVIVGFIKGIVDAYSITSI